MIRTATARTPIQIGAAVSSVVKDSVEKIAAGVDEMSDSLEVFSSDWVGVICVVGVGFSTVVLTGISGDEEREVI